MSKKHKRVAAKSINSQKKVDSEANIKHLKRFLTLSFEKFGTESIDNVFLQQFEEQVDAFTFKGKNDKEEIWSNKFKQKIKEISKQVTEGKKQTIIDDAKRGKKKIDDVAEMEISIAALKDELSESDREKQHYQKKLVDICKNLFPTSDIELEDLGVFFLKTKKELTSLNILIEDCDFEPNSNEGISYYLETYFDKLRSEAEKAISDKLNQKYSNKLLGIHKILYSNFSAQEENIDEVDNEVEDELERLNRLVKGFRIGEDKENDRAISEHVKCYIEKVQSETNKQIEEEKQKREALALTGIETELLLNYSKVRYENLLLKLGENKMARNLQFIESSHVNSFDDCLEKIRQLLIDQLPFSDNLIQEVSFIVRLAKLAAFKPDTYLPDVMQSFFDEISEENSISPFGQLAQKIGQKVEIIAPKLLVDDYDIQQYKEMDINDRRMYTHITKGIKTNGYIDEGKILDFQAIGYKTDKESILPIVIPQLQ